MDNKKKEKKDQKVSLYFSDEEMLFIEQIAKEKGFKKGAFIKSIVCTNLREIESKNLKNPFKF